MEGYYAAMEKTYSKRIDELMAETTRLKGEVEAMKALAIHHDTRAMRFGKEAASYRAAAEGMAPYLEHTNACIRSFWEAGEPMDDGSYRTKFAGKWYQSKPVNEEPKCDCGLDEAWAAWEKVSSDLKGPPGVRG